MNYYSVIKVNCFKTPLKLTVIKIINIFERGDLSFISADGFYLTKKMPYWSNFQYGIL